MPPARAREQIKEAMEKSGVQRPRGRADRGSLHPRQEADSDARRGPGRPREMAAEFGNQPQRVVAEARERAQAQQHNPDRRTHAQGSRDLCADSIFEREAVRTSALILRDALGAAWARRPYREGPSGVRGAATAGEFRSVEGTKHASGRSFTTPETIAAERANIAQCTGRDGTPSNRS